MAAVFLLAQANAGTAAEITVISSGGVRQPLQELFARFERASGHKIIVRFEFGLVVKRHIEAGEAFDVAIASSDVNDLIEKGKVAPGTRIMLGRTGVGVGVRKGMPKPDIGTIDAFKKTLLNSKSVAYAREGGSGLYFTGLLNRLQRQWSRGTRVFSFDYLVRRVMPWTASTEPKSGYHICVVANGLCQPATSAGGIVRHWGPSACSRMWGPQDQKRTTFNVWADRLVDRG